MAVGHLREDTFSLQQKVGKPGLGWERYILELPDKQRPKWSESLVILNIIGMNFGEVLKMH